MPLNNFGAVTSRLLRSAQPDESGFRSLKSLGVRVIVKLNSDLVEAELKACDDLGITLLNMPLDVIPSGEHIRRIAGALNDLLSAKVGRQKILVHCTYGRDRTGCVIGAYRLLYQDWTLDEVNAERESYGVEGLQKIWDVELTAILQEIWDDIQNAKSE
jgi:tyrosine-protein phosphatase SIW14